MLPAAYRMRSSRDFTSVTRTGRRSRSGGLVAYLSTDLSTSLGTSNDAVVEPSSYPRVGLIVGRSVGGSVVRHQVSRRLRAQLASRLVLLPPGAGLVVRALPGLAGADSAQIGRQLDRALSSLLGPQLTKSSR